MKLGTKTGFLYIVVYGTKSRHNMEKKYLTSKQAAALLNVTMRTLYNWRKKQLLVPKAIGGKLLYPADTIEKALIDFD